MSEREELIEQMARKQHFKGRLASIAYRVQHSNPTLADHIDAKWNAASDEIGRLQHRLHEIDAHTSRRERLADAAYGRML